MITINFSTGEKTEMEKLTGEDLAKSANEAAESAAGPDQWGPGDLKKWPPLAFELLARMLNKVEEGEAGRKK